MRLLLLVPVVAVLAAPAAAPGATVAVDGIGRYPVTTVLFDGERGEANRLTLVREPGGLAVFDASAPVRAVGDGCVQSSLRTARCFGADVDARIVADGRDGDDVLRGSALGDVLAGGAGRDVLRGGGGPDILSTTAGELRPEADRVSCGPGQDVVGDPGDDGPDPAPWSGPTVLDEIASDCEAVIVGTSEADEYPPHPIRRGTTWIFSGPCTGAPPGSCVARMQVSLPGGRPLATRVARRGPLVLRLGRTGMRAARSARVVQVRLSVDDRRFGRAAAGWRLAVPPR